MPYEIRKVDRGWKVFTKGTDRSHSNDPLPLKRAKEQLKALYANADDEEKMKGGMIGGFDDRDWDKLFGLYGGAEEEDDEQAKADAEAIIRLEDEKAFDVEEATGEPEYLKQAKAFAKKAGYKDYADLRLADDGKHKLILRGVKFGSINNNDYIIYKQHFPQIADKKRKQYLARATKIKGDWAKNKYSPNSLAINILWDGSSKKGGYDWGELLSGTIKDTANVLGDTVQDLLRTPEQREAERKRKEACKICNGSGYSGGEEKKMNFRKEGDDPRNWGYDEEEEIEAPEEYPEQPQFIGDPSQFKPLPYDPNNPLMYMVGGVLTQEKYDRASDMVRWLGQQTQGDYSGLNLLLQKYSLGQLTDLAEFLEYSIPRTHGAYLDIYKSILPILKREIEKKTIELAQTHTGKGYSGGAVPLNKKLYEQAKAEVYPRYKKPSAYRSGAVVKRYKELGGKFKDNGGRPLARWFKEEWKDVGNMDYPVYRPTKRISKDTPLTPQEIDPENLRLQIREKQKIKGESNLPPFQMKGGRLAQTDAEEMKEARQILHKVAGEGNPEVKEISETPMGDDNIRKYLPNAKILKYSELADIQDITQLLPQPKSYFFLLYEHAPNNGHWCSVNRYINNGKDTIAFFCSYGSKIDAPLYWNSQGRNRELGQDRPYLSQLLRKAQQAGKNIEYNKVQYQSKKSPVATCGAFAVLWIKANLRENMSLQEFHDWIAEIKNETGLSYDAIASNAISQRTF